MGGLKCDLNIFKDSQSDNMNLDNITPTVKMTSEEELLNGDVSEDDVLLLKAECNATDSENVKVMHEKVIMATECLYDFYKCDNKSAAAIEAVTYLSEKTGIPFNVPIQLAYGFIMVVNANATLSDILYNKDIENHNMIDSLNWLTENGSCFVIKLKWEAIDVMKVFITINYNTIQVIRQCPECLYFVEGAASFTNKVVSRTNMTKISMRLLYKLLKRDFKAFEDMTCWYSEVPNVVSRKLERIEKGAILGGMFPVCDCVELEQQNDNKEELEQHNDNKEELERIDSF